MIKSVLQSKLSEMNEDRLSETKNLETRKIYEELLSEITTAMEHIKIS